MEGLEELPGTAIWRLLLPSCVDELADPEEPEPDQAVHCGQLGDAGKVVKLTDTGLPPQPHRRL